MIIFYDKQTGKIAGSIEGRVHGEQHLKMWVGEKDETERIVIEWKPVREKVDIVESEVVDGYTKDENGFDVPVYRKIRQRVVTQEFEPDTDQKEIFEDIDSGKESIYSFKVDTKTKNLIKIEV